MSLTSPAYGAQLMLLFVKKRFADAIASGEKTLEIRAGQRYAKITPGDSISVNGRFRKRVARVEVHDDSISLLDSLRGRYAHAGLADAHDASTALSGCYPAGTGLFYVLHLQPEP